MKLHMILKTIGLLLTCSLLSACLGGTVAQQIVRSIATSIADKQIARAMDVDEDQLVSNRKPNYEIKDAYNQQKIEPKSTIIQPYQPAVVAKLRQTSPFDHLQKLNPAKQNLRNHQPDPLKLAIANPASKKIAPDNIKSTDLKPTDFKPSELEPADLNPLDLKPVAEPIAQHLPETLNTLAVIQTNQLVPVVLINLLIGEEKNAIYEQARLLGAMDLPHKREWQNWQVASGATQRDKKPITFLIPPEFGKLPAGSITMVELAAAGELNVARYKTQ